MVNSTEKSSDIAKVVVYKYSTYRQPLEEWLITKQKRKEIEWLQT